MCGIVGLMEPGMAEGDLSAYGHAMASTIVHRGPDDAGIWVDGPSGVTLGHRRLSIVDLSAAGHQPMLSTSGQYVIVFNGEIYNHWELRRELQEAGTHVWRGHSDTETLLAAIEAWGLRTAIDRARGMFAFALWDTRARALHLVRDRLGEKPLYWAQAGLRIAFASELRALGPIKWIDRSVDPAAITAYLKYLSVPAPATVFEGVNKLRPGEHLTWHAGAVAIRSYWDVGAISKTSEIFANGCAELADALQARLRDSISRQLVADVPVGVFLSGGIDSSTVAAISQECSETPVRTFTLGFKEKSHDESREAREVARHLGTDHHELVLDPAEVLRTIPELTELHDEPFADNGSIPFFLLSQFARKHVKVVLSGDGGDELFGGYPRYFWWRRIEGVRRSLTPYGARFAGEVLEKMPMALEEPLSKLTRGRYSGADGLVARIRRFGGYLQSSPAGVYENMVASCRDTDRFLGVRPSREVGPNPEEWGWLAGGRRMMAVDQSNYLPDDILTKVDRTSMWTSLEVRAPLLDHHLVEWSWGLPAHCLFGQRGDRGKMILRDVLYRYVPRTLIERPKKGFGLPLERWLRGELKTWADRLLDKRRLRSTSLLNPRAVSEEWARHLAGENRLPILWPLIMLRVWEERWL